MGKRGSTASVGNEMRSIAFDLDLDDHGLPSGRVSAFAGEEARGATYPEGVLYLALPNRLTLLRLLYQRLPVRTTRQPKPTSQELTPRPLPPIHPQLELLRRSHARVEDEDRRKRARLGGGRKDASDADVGVLLAGGAGEAGDRFAGDGGGEDGGEGCVGLGFVGHGLREKR